MMSQNFYKYKTGKRLHTHKQPQKNLFLKKTAGNKKPQASLRSLQCKIHLSSHMTNRKKRSPNILCAGISTACLFPVKTMT